MCGTAHAATDVKLNILGEIDTISGIEWQMHEGQPTAHTWKMQGDWVFKVGLPGGKTVSIPTKQMYQLQQRMGVVTNVKLYPAASSVPFEQLIPKLPGLIQTAGFKVSDAVTKTIAEWKAAPADKRSRLTYDGIELSPDKNVELKLIVNSTDGGKTWHHYWEIEATRDAAKAVYKKIAYSKFRQPTWTAEFKTQWNRLTFSKNSDVVFVANDVGDLIAYKTADGSVAYEVNLEDNGKYKLSSPRRIQLSQDGAKLVIGYDKGGIAVVNAADGKLIRTVNSAEGAGAARALSADLSTAACTVDKVVRVISMKDGSTIQEIAAPKRGVEDIALSSDGKIVGITERHIGHGAYYRVGEKEPFQTLKPAGFGKPSVLEHRIMKDGDRVLGYGHMARNASVWSLKTGEMLRAIECRAQNKAVLSADETRIAASTWSTMDYESISIHDIETGKQIDELAGYQAPVYHLGFSPDGNALAAVLKGGTVLLWKLK
jgi:hypothetical protein